MGGTWKIFFLSVVFGLAPLCKVRAAVAPSWLAYGQHLYQQQRYAEAVAAFEQAVAVDPNDAVAEQSLGNALIKLQKQPEALEAYQRSLQLQPQNPALSAYVEKLRGGSGEDAEALEDKLSAARSLLDADDHEAALALFKEGAVLAPASADWPQGEAEALYGLGRFDEARSALKRARQLAPDDKALQRLEQRYYHDGLASDAGGGPLFSPLWRSALLPGWGQAYNGEKHKAWVIGSMTLGLLAATVATYVATDQAIARYEGLGAGASAGDFNAAFGQADGMAQINEALGLGFYAAYAYNLFDAGAHARPLPVQADRHGVRVELLALNF